MLKQLKYFLTVVECNSFTEAAEECFISQSAISQQVSALEEDFGVPLIKREKRKFSLTPAGEYLYRHGKELLEKADQVRRETIRIGQNEEVRLRVGYLGSYEGAWMQETIYEFTAMYPEVILTISKFSHEDLYKHITRDDIDLVFSYQRRAFSQKYENFHLGYIPCLAEISRRNELAGQESVSTEQLKNMPCILVAKKGQRELEQGFFQKTLGIGNSYCFVENMDDARLAVIGDQGFLPAADTGQEAGPSVVRLPIVDGRGERIYFNYCAFWKKERSNYYIEEFVSVFRGKFSGNQ